MRTWWFLALILAAFLLSSTVFSFLQVWGVKPDLVLVLIIVNGFFYGTRDGAFWGFAGGIIEDLLAGGCLGLHALEGLAAGYLAGVAGNKFYRESTGVLAATAFLVSCGAGVVHYLLLVFLSLFLAVHISARDIFLRLIPLSSAYNALAAVLVARLFPGRSQAPPVRPTWH